MSKTDYELFFEKHAYPLGWNQAFDYLLYLFLTGYGSPGSITADLVPVLNALVEGKAHPELPDDWGYEWGTVLPREDYVYLVDASEKYEIEATTNGYTFEMSVLLDAGSVDRKCTKYLKIPTTDMLQLCIAWDDFRVKRRQ